MAGLFVRTVGMESRSAGRVVEMPGKIGVCWPEWPVAREKRRQVFTKRHLCARMCEQMASGGGGVKVTDAGRVMMD